MRTFAIGILAAALALAAPAGALADLYSPNRPLFVMSTAYFDLIFPAQSRSAALYLAGFADDSYREIAALLGTEPGKRFPVIITPDDEYVGGSYDNFPYARITLVQAAIEPNADLGDFDDDLREVFRHELTHAVSLTIWPGIQKALTAVFGDPAGLSYYTAPNSLVEGVTVSFESMDGYGRAADPLAGAVVRQDILEGAFKTWHQAMGAWDRYPGGLHYVYGGYFSAYLQRRYGIERYAELWHRIGTGMIAKGLGRGLLSEGHFREVYGIGLEEAWSDFRDSMAIRVPVLMDARPLRRPSGGLPALAALGETIAYADSERRAVFACDPAAGGERLLFRVGMAPERLDADGTGRILVSGYDLEGGFLRLDVRVWDPAEGALAELPWRGLRDAAWAGPLGIAAIRIDGYETDLVLAKGGEIRVLLEGTERIAYSSPVVSDDGGTLHALVKIDGEQSLLRLCLSGGAVASAEILDLPDGVGRLRYLSRAEDGRLFSAWDDDKLYRLVEIEGESFRYQTVPLSGGIHLPLAAGGRLCYVGRFSEGLAPCVLEADRGALGFVETRAEWDDASWLLKSVSAYDEEAAPPAERAAAGERAERPYSILPWLLPRFWHPTFAVTEDGIADIGAAAYIADPAGRIDAALSAAWDLRARAVEANLDLNIGAWDPTISLWVDDSFDPRAAAEPDGEQLRSSAAALALSGIAYRYSGGYLAYNLQAGAEASASFAAGTNPYSSWEGANLTAATRLSWQDRNRRMNDATGARYGFEASATLIGELPFHPAWGDPAAGLELSATGALPWFGLALRLDGAAGLAGGMEYSPSGRRLGAFEYAAGFPEYVEFAGGPPGRYYGQAELSMVPLAAEIQRGRALYLNAVRLRAGARGCAAASIGGGAVASDWSAFGALELVCTPAYGFLATVHPILSAELWYRPRDGRQGIVLGVDLDY